LCAATVPDHGIEWSDAIIAHLPDPVRLTTVPSMIEAGRGLRFADLVTDFAWRARGTDGSTLASIAEGLRDLSSSSDTAFEAQVLAIQRRVHAAHRARLGAPLGGVRPCPAWIAARDTTDRLLRSTADHLDSWWRDHGARSVGALATVLSAWPDLWNAARDADHPVDRARRLLGT
jgi:hypothetical protein